MHHIVIRAIERKWIFEDDKDREDFLERLSGLLQKMVTPCYAWALMTNHVHLLLRTGTVPMASPTKRLKIAQARALVSHIATRELSIPGSEVARRLNVDRSAISRAVQRVGNDPELIAAARRILGLLESETSQH